MVEKCFVFTGNYQQKLFFSQDSLCELNNSFCWLTCMRTTAYVAAASLSGKTWTTTGNSATMELVNRAEDVANTHRSTKGGHQIFFPFPYSSEFVASLSVSSLFKSWFCRSSQFFSKGAVSSLADIFAQIYWGIFESIYVFLLCSVSGYSTMISWVTILMQIFVLSFVRESLSSRITPSFVEISYNSINNYIL